MDLSEEKERWEKAGRKNTGRGKSCKKKEKKKRFKFCGPVP